MAVRLSKSRYVAGLQCPKRLYLEIHEGMMASLQFHRMAFGDGDSAEKETIRTALLTYCERDTLAMVELRKALGAKAHASHRMWSSTGWKTPRSGRCRENVSPGLRYSWPLS